MCFTNCLQRILAMEMCQTESLAWKLQTMYNVKITRTRRKSVNKEMATKLCTLATVSQRRAEQ